MSNLVFEQATKDVVEREFDAYPSRNGQKAKLRSRLDPVVYASNEGESPVGRDVINRYNEQGFVVLKDVFTRKEVTTYQQELERLRADPLIQASAETITEPHSKDVRSIFRMHKKSLLLKTLAADKRLVDLARYILGDDVYIHQSRLNYKPGFRGKEFYWHSDFETWHAEDGMPRMRALSMSITLTENLDCNGPLMLIPGSHKQYAVCEGATPEDHYLDSLKKQEYGVPTDDCLQTLATQGGIVSAISEPGSVILFDCNVMHGSNGNITPYPRSNIFFVYNALSNKVVSPFCGQMPRPEHVCTRQNIVAIPQS
ncbi:MAG: ectoine hydroxylase [Candidatus Endobugula sp.]|jgi:ectoine hydroxylase